MLKHKLPKKTVPMTDKAGLLRFELYDENELTWQQHHAIHEALNRAYIYRTKSFIKKTFAQSEPIKRVLCYEGNLLIGHSAIFESYVLIGRRKVKIAGIGMTLSLKPGQHIGYLVREYAATVCKLEGYPFAISRVKNNEKTKKNLQGLVFGFLDMPLIGNHSESHHWETLAIYNTGGNLKQVNKIIDYFKQQGFVRVRGEVF